MGYPIRCWGRTRRARQLGCAPPVAARGGSPLRTATVVTGCRLGQSMGARTKPHWPITRPPTVLYGYPGGRPGPSGACLWGCVSGWVGVGVAVVGLTVVTAGADAIPLAGVVGIGGAADALGIGGVTTGTALDVTAVTAGGAAAGFDCADHPDSAQCFLDISSIGLGGVGGDRGRHGVSGHGWPPVERLICDLWSGVTGTSGTPGRAGRSGRGERYVRNPVLSEHHSAASVLMYVSLATGPLRKAERPWPTP